jgi:hypothetical protein
VGRTEYNATVNRSPVQGRAYTVRSQDLRKETSQKGYVRMYPNSRSKQVTKSSRPVVQVRPRTNERHARFQLPNDIASTQNDTTERSQSVTLAPFTGKPKITVKLTITRSNLLYVPVRIGDGYLDTLIDTGASYTFMDMSMLKIISKRDSQFSTVQLRESEVGAIECSNGSHQDICRVVVSYTRKRV